MLNYLLIMIFVKIEVKYNMNFISTTPISLKETEKKMNTHQQWTIEALMNVIM